MGRLEEIKARLEACNPDEIFDTKYYNTQGNLEFIWNVVEDMRFLLPLAEIGMRVEATEYESGATEFSEEFIWDSGFNYCLGQLKRQK